MKSPLRYVGGKYRARKIIYSHLPKGLTKIASPFLGGGNFEFYCMSKDITVYGNDKFSPLINFYNHIKDKKSKVILVEEVRKIFKEGMTRKKFQYMYDDFQEQYAIHRAAWFFVINRCSYSGRTFSGGCDPNFQRFTKSSIDYLQKFKISDVLFFNLDWKLFLETNPHHFLYLDPPYVGNEYFYGCKFQKLNEFNHEELRNHLVKRENWIMSYQEHPDILELYKGHKIIYTGQKHCNIKEGALRKGGYSKEMLIFSKEEK